METKEKLQNIEVIQYFTYLAENEVLVKTFDGEYKLLTDNTEKVISLDEAVEFYENNPKCD